jgi:Domain of unknown function (DUF6378)
MRDPLLTEREKTHGKFERTARISMDFKELMFEHGAADLCPVQREAMMMIAVKIARILSGNALHREHWLDISGYSFLAMEACPDDDKQTTR